MSSRALRHVLRVVLLFIGLAVAVLFVQAFVGDVYYVDSRSMEPTLHGDEQGGEHVFVRYEKHPALARFDLVILELAGKPEPIVKRVVALPKEEVQVSGGDLFIGGERLGPDAPRPPLVALFDSEREELTRAFKLGRDRGSERWTHSGNVWRLDGRGEDSQLAQYITPATDDYFAPDGVRVAGNHQVGDLALELELGPIEGDWKRVVLRLSEEGDVFEVELTPDGTERAHARLLRGTQALGSTDVPFARGARHRLRFSNIDNDLRFDLDAKRAVLSSSYSANTPLQRMPDAAYQHQWPRVAFGGDDLVAEFRRVRVSRDFHYTALGRHGTERSQALGPDEIFVLGDNSGESTDSREWGPVKISQVIGRPVWVVWPFARMRALRPTGAASE